MSRLEPFVEVACDFQHYIWLGFMVSVFLLVLSLFALYFAPYGTASFYLAVVDFAIALTLTLTSGGMYYLCAQRAAKTY